MKRYLRSQILDDLKHKMVFLGGPRQVGKTTLARSLLRSDSAYFNWDFGEHREKILKMEFPRQPLLVLDELHKYRKWRNYLKGFYDVRGKDYQILVTGSARLDYYRFGGDSLQGRYHYLRLHPFSAAELRIRTAASLMDLIRLSGFPEPFLAGSEDQARRWSREHRQFLLQQELRDLESIHDLGQMELLMLRLPELVGSPLSINALTEDLQISHKTIARWLEILERIYAIFRLAPFGAPRIRAVKKAQKHYHFDWNVIADQGPRFENVIAAQLLKWVHFQIDTTGHDMELRYFRDTDGREVDFVVLRSRRPLLLVEARWSDSDVAPGLRYLKERFPEAEAWQISATGRKDYVSREGIRVAPALELLSALV
ncbi:MAG: ATP-binding protein [Gammaproteobacteria bacterium]|nr:MAG: ATP-binding protein [Gammaproteobacteria bacterium]